MAGRPFNLVPLMGTPKGVLILHSIYGHCGTVALTVWHRDRVTLVF